MHTWLLGIILPKKEKKENRRVKIIEKPKKQLTLNNLIADCVCVDGEIELRVTVEGVQYYRKIDIQSASWTVKRIVDAINQADK